MRNTLRRIGTRAGAVMASAAGLALASGSASALTINLTFDANVPGSTATAGTVRHLINSAANMWEDWIEDSHTLNLTIGWTNTGGSTLAVHSLTSQSGGRETAGNIDFGSQWSWFIDSTPLDDNEFTMASTIWRDVSASNRAAWFNGTALNEFEVGRTGNATGGGGAAGLTDMLSVALHEMGHALGMSAANTATQAETADGDYDFSTTLTRGGALAAVIASGGNIAHLNCNLCNMFPSVGTGIRRLPSPTDIFSMASASNWTDIDLDRKFFHANNGDWATNGNWIGNDQPDSTEDAYLVDGNTANVNGAGEVARGLFISEAANVNVNNGGTLSTFALAIVDGDDSDIVVNEGGTYNANGGLTLRNGDAQLFLFGGTVNVNGTLDISVAEADVIGRGTVTVNGGDLVNDGTVTASGGDLIFNTSTAGTWDLDGGSGAGVVNATGGNITFNGTLNDAFDGVININADRTLTFTDGWSHSGTVNMNTGTTNATLAGGAMTTSGVATIDVTGTGVAIVSENSTLNSGFTATVDAGETINFSGGGTFNGGTITGAGRGETDGNWTYTGTTTIDVATLDWDGGFLGHTHTVNAGATLNINSNIADAMDDLVVVNGTLNVNAPSGQWTMSNTLTMNSGAVAGGTAEMNLSGGTIDANGTANRFLAPIEIFSTGAVVLTAAGDQLQLEGPITYRGGSYTGAGLLRQYGDATVATSTTINTGEYDWDGGGFAVTNVNAGATFTINSATIDAFANNDYDGTANVAGALVINTSTDWMLDGSVNLTAGGATLSGRAFEVTNVGMLTGFGTVTSQNINNNGTIAGNGGTLTISTTNFADLDGSNENGVLSALNGGLRITGNFGSEFGFDGTLNIGGGNGFTMTNHGIFNSGTMNMSGGTYTAPSFTQADTLNVTAGVNTLSSASVFAAGSTTSIAAPASLRINGSASFVPTASVTGGGTLEVLAGSTASGNANLAVNVLNRGTITPGTSPGVWAINGNYGQTATGRYAWEAAGTGVAQADRINITGNASLGGTLDISLSGGFVPDWGDSWTIMSYGSRTGDFTSFVAPALAPNLFWWRSVGATTYVLGVRNGADTNRDGVVDFLDLNNVLSFFGQAAAGTFGLPGLIGDANEDGAVDFLDLNLVLSFFGQSAPANLIPTPGSAALMTLAAGLMGSRRRRTQVA